MLRRSRVRSDHSITYTRQTPTGGYVLAPKTMVCPGKGSRYIPLELIPRGEVSKNLRVSLPFYKEQEDVDLSPIVVEKTQGLLQIHFKQLNLPQEAIVRIDEAFGFKLYTLKISWTLLNFKRTLISVPSSKNTTNEIQTSVLYVISARDNFFEFISENALVLKLYATNGEKEVYLASGELSLDDIGNTELHRDVDFCDSDRTTRSGAKFLYGTLAMWHRFSCALDTVSKEDYRSPLSITSIMHSSSAGSISTNYTFNREVEPTESEVEHFQEALDLVLVRNKALKLTQSDITTELEDRAQWLHEESNWKRTLQEHAILIGKDPRPVRWRQWRASSSVNLKPRDYENNVVSYSMTVAIFISGVTLLGDLGEEFRRFFVTYSFLTHNEESEHKPSTNRNIELNFEKVFAMNPELNKEDCSKLVNDIQDDQSFVVRLFGEFEDEESTTHNKEIGITKLAYLDLIEQTSNELFSDLALRQRDNGTADLGYVTMSMQGILAMRQIALKLMAPPDYTVNYP